MRIPTRHRKVTFGGVPDDTPQKPIIARYLQHLRSRLSDGDGLFFHGVYGSGKTGAACLILKAVAVIGKTGLFVVSRHIPDAIIRKLPFSEAETLHERMLHVDLLVVDELIVRGKDTFGETAIEDVFRDRLLASKATIFTSNQTPQQVEKAFPALVSAMEEAVDAVPFAEINLRADKRRELKERVRG